MSTGAKRVVRWRGGRRERGRDELAVEEPLQIRVDAQPLTVTMRTPGHDEELAAGYVFTEGMVKQRSDLACVRAGARNRVGNVIDVGLAPEVCVEWQQWQRHTFVASSCGLCGKTTMAAVHHEFPPLRPSRLRFSVQRLLELPARMHAAQKTFARTGGLHAAAVFDRAGELVVVREDIGRHNAVDKVIGHGLLHGLLPFGDHVLVISGRASFEIMQKALAARVPVVCAVSAPSSLAVEFARKSRMTLVGFVREERLTVYAGEARIEFSEE